MNRGELVRAAAKEGVPLGTVEKDYVLSIALKAIAESKLLKFLVFKGGTAIRKIYFREARFSEDLDFSVLSGSTKVGVLEGLTEALGDKEIEGVRFGKVEEEKTAAGLKVGIKFSGPLGYGQRIRFDFSFRENLVQEPSKKPIIDLYKLGDCELSVLSLEELFAEKIHALGSRAAPRDLYDVWFLLREEVQLDKELVEKKFAFYGEKFEKDKVEANAKKVEKNWKQDLGQLVKDVPKLDSVTQEVLARL
ncbi:MAG: nucleotidyl transferase AbiEii/AbiGii toxin family protein [Candidatus Micrarchaeota archaeon]